MLKDYENAAIQKAMYQSNLCLHNKPYRKKSLKKQKCDLCDKIDLVYEYEINLEIISLCHNCGKDFE